MHCIGLILKGRNQQTVTYRLSAADLTLPLALSQTHALWRKQIKAVVKFVNLEQKNYATQSPPALGVQAESRAQNCSRKSCKVTGIVCETLAILDT